MQNATHCWDARGDDNKASLFVIFFSPFHSFPHVSSTAFLSIWLIMRDWDNEDDGSPCGLILMCPGNS